MGEKRTYDRSMEDAPENCTNMKNFKINEDDESKNAIVTNVLAQFYSESGEVAGPPIELPVILPREKLELILQTFLKEEDPTPYSFFVEEEEIKTDLRSSLTKLALNEERILKILYQPQAVFRVKAVTRCTSSLSGHSEAVLHALFSPDGQALASGSGDATLRFWDIHTETPVHESKGHKHWVLVTSWSPDGEKVASACKAGVVIVWDPNTGKQVGRCLVGHKQWVTCLAWEPIHTSEGGACHVLASGGKDGDVRVWDTRTCACIRVLSGHSKSVTALRWGGQGYLYSASQDRTINVWNAADGALCRKLSGHAHWVNTLALNTDYVLRTGAADPKDLVKSVPEFTKKEDRLGVASRRYAATLAVAGAERLVSGSDDFTLFLWEPTRDKQPLARLTGHQQLVNDVKFSPDSRLVASASFDKSIRLWNGADGRFVGVLRGHVAGVYQIAWSADSRLLVSGSKDSTLKVWNVSKRKLEVDLPGHADEVYAVDWSPDGQRVVSGGKDKVIKIWRR